MKRAAYILAALVAVYLVTPSFVVVLKAALPYTETCDGETSPIGSPWTVISTPVVFANVSNDCQGATVDAYAIAIATGESPTANQKTDAASDEFAQAYVCVRMAGTSLADAVGYCATSVAGTVYLVEFDGDGAPAVLTTFSDAATSGDIRIEIVGSLIEVFINNVSVGTQSDGTLTTGKHAIVFYGTSGRLDNIVLSNIASGATCRGALSLLGVGGC